MPAVLRIDADAFREALRHLPVELRDAAAGIVHAAADTAEREIRAGYPAGPTGELREGLSQSEDRVSDPQQLGVVVRLRNTAKEAWWYEYGTELRHTKQGWARGRMPAKPVFVPKVTWNRARMVDQLIALVERAGFRVRGR